MKAVIFLSIMSGLLTGATASPAANFALRTTSSNSLFNNLCGQYHQTAFCRHFITRAFHWRYSNIEQSKRTTVVPGLEMPS